MRFAIAATPEQIASAQQQITALMRKKKEDKTFKNERNCVGSVCDILAKAGIDVPFPFHESPLLLAAYLRLRQSVPGDIKVTSVRFVGGDHLPVATKKSLGEGVKVAAAAGGFALASVAPVLGAVLFDCETDDGKKETVVVPLIQNSASESKDRANRRTDR